MMQQYYAPVLLSVYNRTDHFKKCVSSLLRCNGADQTEVYITSDAASKPVDEPKVKEIRAYISKISGFKKVVPIISKENTKGEIIKKGYAIIFAEHDRLIRSEDDNIFAIDFLDFVSQGLELYKNRTDVFAITGYNSPVIIPEWYRHDAYLRKSYPPWGVGLWRDKWQKVNRSHNAIKMMFNNTIKDIKKEFPSFFPGLVEMSKTGIIVNDLFHFLYMYDQKMFSVYPTITRVKNIGTDGSGLHTSGLNKKYANQELIMEYKDFSLPRELSYSEELNIYIRNQYKETFYDKAINLLRGPARALGIKADRYALENYLKSVLQKKY